MWTLTRLSGKTSDTALDFFYSSNIHVQHVETVQSPLDPISMNIDSFQPVMIQPLIISAAQITHFHIQLLFDFPPKMTSHSSASLYSPPLRYIITTSKLTLKSES